MKKIAILAFILFAGSHVMFCQVADNIYAPNQQYYDSFSAEESWEIHKAAYIKQLEAKGLTDAEIKEGMVTYEKDKEAFIARVKEQHRLAAIQREKAAELRKMAKIQRAKAAEQRKLADIQRQQADVQRQEAEILREKAAVIRKQAIIARRQADEIRINSNVQRKKAELQREQAEIQRAKADEQRKLAEIQRAKADELRKLAEIQREKADEQRKLSEIQREKAEAWRKSFKNIVTKNVTLSKRSNNNEPITFNLNSKTTLRVGIRAQISSGTAKIEIYNPNGEKEGELSLAYKSESVSSNEDASFKFTSGSFDKTISDVNVGEWKVKILSQNAEGTVAVSVAQFIKPTVDE